MDQPDEIFSAGDFFFVPPGHRLYMLEDTELLQITGKDEVGACGDGASCAGTATKCKCTTSPDVPSCHHLALASPVGETHGEDATQVPRGLRTMP